jgi:UDP-GlcNAc:undecaprenyl-phosphate/decaprenyl-phosphate GlcNAc-1-phosphate transferase
MISTFIILTVLAVISYFVTDFGKSFAIKKNIVDDPAIAPKRKSQKNPIPLLGGLGFGIVGIVGSFVTFLAYSFDLFGLHNYFEQNMFNGFQFGWILAACVIILIGGYLDDKYNLSAKKLLIHINLALFISVFLGGLKINTLSYPFDWIEFGPFLQYILAYIWIGLCLSATKFLDGHDGLVSSVGVLNLLSIALISSFANINQPFITIISLIWVAAITGFLPFNIPNAKMYLGESGSELIGFLIGVMSIISGAKIATTATIVGWFIFDLALVIFIRLKNKKSIVEGGREHWHFRLLDAGLTKWQVLLLTLLILTVSGVFGLVLPTIYKPLVFLGQLIVFLMIFWWTNKKAKEKNTDSSEQF